MATRIVQTMIFRYAFGELELRPLVEMQQVADGEDILATWASHRPMVEKARRGGLQRREEAQVMAESQRGGESKGEQTYKITYYNPELEKAEVLETESIARIDDPAKRAVEESLAVASAFAVYSYIATPIMKRETVPWILDQIKSEREYGTPPPFGAGSVVRIKPKPVTSEIVAVRRGKAEKEAFAEAMARKRQSEEEMQAEIIVLEGAVEAVRGGRDVRESLRRLPPLTRARFLVAVRKLGLSRGEVLSLLLRDLRFLRGVKKGLSGLNPRGLLELVKALKKLQKRE